ncbi:hypothetical protein G8J22_00743 [Lentilactobacillus hilgardii]|nr:hypothetical protein G8J22_00743 [Lentilactobacillus hilgardii]
MVITRFIKMHTLKRILKNGIYKETWIRKIRKQSW